MRSSLLLLGCLGSIVTAFATGCGDDSSSNNDVFDCKTSSISNGQFTVCEQIGATEPGKYECAPPSGAGSLALRNVTVNSDTATSQHDCPAGTVPQSQNPPVNGDSTDLGQTGGAGGQADDGTQVSVDGTSTNGSHHAGSTPPVNTDQTSSGGPSSSSGSTPPVNTDQTSSGGPSSSSGGSSSGAPSSSSGGSSGAPGGGGGGYTCESTGSKTTCTSTTCEAGYHAGANNTCVPDAAGCTLTQGYWKNHLNKWPVTSLTLGGKTYSQGELLTIFNTPPTGDASLILAHQLIAALLNVKSGASVVPVSSVITQAQAWLSSNGSTLPYGIASSSTAGAQAVALAKQLDDFNNGLSGVPHCN